MRWRKKERERGGGGLKVSNKKRGPIEKHANTTSRSELTSLSFILNPAGYIIRQWSKLETSPVEEGIFFFFFHSFFFAN